MKSPRSMRNGRFHPSKCRGKVQKMGVLYIHPSKMPGSSQTSSKYQKIKYKLNEKVEGRGGGRESSLQFVRLRAVVDRWLPAIS
jgi:hypothetical protein